MKKSSEDLFYYRFLLFKNWKKSESFVGKFHIIYYRFEDNVINIFWHACPTTNENNTIICKEMISQPL